jgi:cyclohexadieny/prephenate dehydrogenase
MTTSPIGTVVILGYGLIGASIARGLRARDMATTIHAFDTNQTTLLMAQADGVLNRVATELKQAEALLSQADMVLWCLPPAALLNTAQQLAHAIPTHAIVSDVASVKAPVADSLRRLLPNPERYIPAHPIAGSASSGAGHSHPDLFLGRPCILTPEMGIEMDDPALVAVRGMWLTLGSTITLMPATLHDTIYAHVSHLPQILAYAAGHTVLQATPRATFDDNEIMQRFLRLSRSDAGLWSEILILNVGEVLPALETSIAILKHMRTELAEGASQPAPSADITIEAPELMQLYARIISSSLVMSVLQLERQSKMKVASYAGAGFADMAAPCIEAPDPEFERISAAYAELIAMLDATLVPLEAIASHMHMQQFPMMAQQLHMLQARDASC